MNAKKIVLMSVIYFIVPVYAQNNRNNGEKQTEQTQNNHEVTYTFINKSNDKATIQVEFKDNCSKEHFVLANREIKQIKSSCAIKKIKVDDLKVPNIEGRPITAVHGTSNGPYQAENTTFVIEASMAHPTYSITQH